MVRAYALSLPLAPDGKRITAISLTMAVHLVVLMLLMMPMQSEPLQIIPDRDNALTVILVDPPIPVITVPIAPRPQVTPQTPTHPIRTATAAPTDSVLVPVDSGEVQTTPADSDVVADTYSPALPTLAELSADIAPPPPYPPLAWRRGDSGEVMLRILVDAQGRAVEGKIETSSGSRVLDQAALKFVLAHWHFRPASQNGVAVPAYALVPIDFVLSQ